MRPISLSPRRNVWASLRALTGLGIILPPLSGLALLTSASAFADVPVHDVEMIQVPDSPSTPSLNPTASPIDSRYMLGPGDRLYLTFLNVPEYDGEEQVSVDGSINVPLLGNVQVGGLSIEEATAVIEAAYADYLRTPTVNLDVVRPRPISIGISGEVNRPGSYDIALTNGDNDGVIEWPTLVEAIQQAGGITDRADVRGVEIRRHSFLNQGELLDQDSVIQIDLWEVLTTGNLQNDITLRDGDAIHIPTADTLTPEELTQLAAANFSPDSIRVTVVGEVMSPGTIEISPNAPLNQALLAAGGFNPERADNDEVQLVRLNPDGTVSQRDIAIDFEHGINEDTNPSLRNNDVVLVGRSGRATFSDAVGSVVGPLGAILTPFQLLLNLF